MSHDSDQLTTGRASTAQRGAVMPLMAIMMFVLLGAAAMAVDLGWLYWNSIDIQHGADAAALAGVIYEPEMRTDAHTEGIAAAKENGFIDTGAGGTDTVEIFDFADDPTLVEHDNQLRATITHPTGTFFMKIFGIETINIGRTAVAQYALPVALGSPDSYLGADPYRDLYPGFYMNIHGGYEGVKEGDRFGPACDVDEWGSGCEGDPSEENPHWRPSGNLGNTSATGGYVYGIEVPDGATGLVVEILDGPLYREDDWGMTNDLAGPMDVWFMLYGPDPTPLDTTDNELLCSVKYEGEPGGTDRIRSYDVAGWNDSWDEWDDVSPKSLILDLWDSMATSADKEPGCAASFDRGGGIYPLRVVIKHDNSENAMNRFSMRSETNGGAGPQPNFYGLGDMSIYALPGSGSTTKVYLAYIGEEHAGKDVIVQLWDAGDISGSPASDELEFLFGDGSTADCSWEAVFGLDGGAPVDSAPLGTCIIPSGANAFDRHMLTITIPIPDSYTCSDLTCWVQVDYNYSDPGNVHDTTTWEVFVDGDPLAIVK